MNQNEIIKSAMRDLRVGTLLTFIGINLRFVSGNVINALIFFNILQSESTGRRFDIHAPSTPDICCDVVMIIVFTVAYLFITSNQIKNVRMSILHNIHEMSNLNLSTIRRLKDYIHQSRGIFSATIIGVSMYLFSRYVLSIGLEVSFIENTTGTFFVLNMLNDILRLCSPLIFVNVYCKYLSTNKYIMFILYLFFIIRNLFATNMLGLISEYDLHVGAPFLDILSPIIIIYTAAYFFANFKAIVYKEQKLVFKKFTLEDLGLQTK
ncbi:MAG TPA: hypothetical protein ACFYEH_10040 [Candidatus Brocadiaceae bacterium]